MSATQEQNETIAAVAVDCPQCGLPAQIVDRFTLGGSPGPVEHVKIVCIVGHWFTPPIDRLLRLRSGQSEADSDRDPHVL